MAGRYRKLLFTTVLSAFTLVVCGQGLNSAYFLSGSFSRHEMNPAFAPERNYFSLPVIGGFGTDIVSNAGASNFIYNSISYPGKLTTFMSGDVDRVEFLNGLKDVTRLNAGISMDVFSFGFTSFGGYNTVGFRVRNNETVRLPKELFEFMKSGLVPGEYSIDDVRVRSNTYADLALGHSRMVGDRLRLGATLHLLAGAEYLDMNVSHIEATTMASKWNIRMNGTVNASGEITYGKKSDGAVDLNDIKYKFPGVSGFGLAFDLGAAYDMSDIVDGLSLSASVTDLGFISWSKGKTFATDPNKTVEFDGFHDVSKTSDIEDQFDKIGEDFKAMTNLYETESGSFSGNPTATLRLGILYRLPWVDWISAGELLTYMTGYNNFESRTSVNIAPAKWFDASLNLAFSSYATNMGWVINFHPKGFNFYIGSDGLKVKLSNNIPTTATSANIVLGMRFPLGDL